MSQYDFLKKINEEKQPLIKNLYTTFGINFFKEKHQQFPHISFYDALKKNKLNLIAELKKASPSKGLINPHFNPKTIATQYKEMGASALSVLTEETYFQGSIDYLSLAKLTANLPILRKDFITDPIELHEAKANGADAALLIKAMLNQNQCQLLLDTAKTIGLDILLEIHTEEEMKEALELNNVTIIGINNRNLHTLKVDTQTASSIKKLVNHELTSKNILSVAESGYNSLSQLKSLQSENFNAVLIGEGLVTHPEILDFWSSSL